MASGRRPMMSGLRATPHLWTVKKKLAGTRTKSKLSGATLTVNRHQAKPPLPSPSRNLTLRKQKRTCATGCLVSWKTHYTSFLNPILQRSSHCSKRLMPRAERTKVEHLYGTASSLSVTPGPTHGNKHTGAKHSPRETPGHAVGGARRTFTALLSKPPVPWSVHPWARMMTRKIAPNVVCSP